MDIKTYLQRKKIKPSYFAKDVGISHAYLSQIMSGVRKPSKYVALVIEAKSKGAIKAKKLRPDIKKLT